MTNELQSLLHAIATAKTEEDLRLRFMDGVSQCFGIQRWGIYLFDHDHRLAHFDVHGVSDSFVERYEKVGKSVDPVLHYVLNYHAPAHEELVFPQGGWKRSELYQTCCSEYDHEHIMTGPIVGRGQLIGTVHFARVNNTPAFDAEDLQRLGAVCTHLSVSLAELRQQPSIQAPILNPLTARELQIARLVAQGHTNTEIGAELWITQNSVKQALKRMFRKLDVSARTELVAKLRDVL